MLRTRGLQNIPPKTDWQKCSTPLRHSDSFRRSNVSSYLLACPQEPGGEWHLFSWSSWLLCAFLFLVKIGYFHPNWIALVNSLMQPTDMGITKTKSDSTDGNKQILRAPNFPETQRAFQPVFSTKKWPRCQFSTSENSKTAVFQHLTYKTKDIQGKENFWKRTNPCAVGTCCNEGLRNKMLWSGTLVQQDNKNISIWHKHTCVFVTLGPAMDKM